MNINMSADLVAHSCQDQLILHNLEDQVFDCSQINKHSRVISAWYNMYVKLFIRELTLSDYKCRQSYTVPGFSNNWLAIIQDCMYNC